MEHFNTELAASQKQMDDSKLTLDENKSKWSKSKSDADYKI